MEKLRSKLILLLTAIIMIAGLASRQILTNMLSNQLFSGFLIIPIFFMLLGLGTIFFLTQNTEIDARKRATRYMLHRTVKILLSVTLVLIYWAVNKPEIKIFATVFVIYYLIFLMFETYTYMQVEKTLKKNENQN